jgi:ABC-type phosphate transport system permease subunit
MRKIRFVKDIIARHFMLGIAIFTILFLLLMGFSLFIKALPIMKEKNLGYYLLLLTGSLLKVILDFFPTL